jgi:tetratricopeptide (TPR) repeat protein
MDLISIFAGQKLVECCIYGILGNRVDAGTKWLATAGFNRLSGEASSESPVVLQSMHKAFVLSIAAMEKACDSVGGDPVSNMARRALRDFARSKDLRTFDRAAHQLRSDLLEEQVRTIYGQQAKTPKAAATDRAIALVEAGMRTALSEPLRQVFHEGHGRYPGWADQFEMFFAAEVGRNQALANILALDRENEAIARLEELRVLGTHHANDLADLRADIESGFDRFDQRFDEIKEAILSLETTQQAEAIFPEAALDVLETAARDGDLTDRQKQRIVELYGKYLARTTTIAAPIVEASIRNLAESADDQLLAMALRDMAGEDRAKVVAEREEQLEGDVARTAGQFRELASVAALDSIANAVRLYRRAADLDPGDVWTWIALARLHEAAGNLGDARRAAEAARQYAEDARDQMAAHSELGDICIAEGALTSAKEHFHAAMQVAVAAAAADPENEVKMHDLSVAQDKLGGIERITGDLAAAGERFRASLAICEALVIREPGKAEWQRGLSISHEKLGDIEKAGGDLDVARSRYATSLTIREDLALREPGNAEWQRDLSVSYNKLGDIEMWTGQLDAARERYVASLVIREGLASREPGNAEWQRDLSVSHNKLGDVEKALGNLAAARTRYASSLTICEGLVSREPGNAEWQRDLSFSHERLGDLAEAMDDLPEAVALYRASLPIAQALADRWPDHPQFADDLAITQRRLAELEDQLPSR